MLAYVTVGVADLERARKFYDALFEGMGAAVLMDMERLLVYGTGSGGGITAETSPLEAIARRQTSNMTGTDGKRSAGSLAKALSNKASIAGAIAGLTAEGGGKGACTCFRITASGVSAS